MLTREQFNRILVAIKMPVNRPSVESQLEMLNDSKYFKETMDWSDWASTVANMILPDANTEALCALIQGTDDLDSAYSYYEEAIDNGYIIRPIFTKLAIYTHRPKSLTH